MLKFYLQEGIDHNHHTFFTLLYTFDGSDY